MKISKTKSINHMLWLFPVFFLVFGVFPTFGQATFEECERLYKTFVENRKGPEQAKLQNALKAGKAFQKNCGDMEELEEAGDYIATFLPQVEAKLPANKRQSDWSKMVRTDQVVFGKPGKDRQVINVEGWMFRENLEGITDVNELKAAGRYVLIHWVSARAMGDTERYNSFAGVIYVANCETRRYAVIEYLKYDDEGRLIGGDPQPSYPESGWYEQASWDPKPIKVVNFACSQAKGPLNEMIKSLKRKK